MKRAHPLIKGYKLIAPYPGLNRPLGFFEPYTTGLYSNFPHLWEPVYWQDVVEYMKIDKILECQK
jgi:hypothetical protein